MSCLTLQIVLQSLRLLYSIPMYFLLVDFLNQGCSDECNEVASHPPALADEVANHSSSQTWMSTANTMPRTTPFQSQV